MPAIPAGGMGSGCLARTVLPPIPSLTTAIRRPKAGAGGSGAGKARGPRRAPPDESLPDLAGGGAVRVSGGNPPRLSRNRDASDHPDRRVRNRRHPERLLGSAPAGDPFLSRRL